MKWRPLLLILLFCGYSIAAISQRLKVSENKRFLVKEDGTPFFWMADTAWELFHRCDRKDAEMYLKKRKEQGFNVIHAVALAELNGLTDTNPYNEIPLFNQDPNQPNDAYFKHVDYIIGLANDLDMYIALLPAWGDKVFKNNWGVGPEVFTIENAENYGRWIGNRYKDYDNIIWVIGGDRNPREDHPDKEIWNAMANGISEACGGFDKTLMTFHPQPKEGGGSSTWFHEEEWLDFNMHQTGHCANKPTYENIRFDYDRELIKPVLDGEPLYEDHPNCFNAKELGYSVADDIRRIMYWNVFAGGFGQSYGCHAVWQMYSPEKEPINVPLRPWKQALDLPLANQVKHLKRLMLSRPFLSRIPDHSMVVDDQDFDEEYVIATRDENYGYAMIYFPTGKPSFFDLSGFKSEKIKTSWYDPRSGITIPGMPVKNLKEIGIKPPSQGKGNDWVLILDDPNSK